MSGIAAVIDHAGQRHGYRALINGRWVSSQSKEILEALLRGEEPDKRQYTISNKNGPKIEPK